MNVRFFPILMLVLACWVFTSCNDDDEEIKDGPTPDNPPITSSKHEYVCTKWVADSVSEENNYILSIEFLYDGVCYILTQYDVENECNVSKFGHIDRTKRNYSFIEDSITGVFIEDNLIVNESDTFIKDPNYVAPMYDNGLVGHWEGDYMGIGIGSKIILNIIDNERLIFFVYSNETQSYRIITNYTYDNKSITFNGKTYPLNEKEIFTDYGTYKFKY